MPTEMDEFHNLSFYTLDHPDKEYFIHQHVVDAFQAQAADASTKPIGLVFALIGLYLYLEKGFTGKEVQRAHMKLAENKKPWPMRPLPVQRGEITVNKVMQSAPGPERDQMIAAWCSSVWNAYHDWHASIRAFTDHELHL